MGTPYERKNVKELQKKLGIDFRVGYTLLKAITRRSYKNEHKEIDRDDNERLEFLGDGVLKLVLCDHLYQNSDDLEGQMTKMRIALENNATLASIAKKMGIKEHILMTESEKKLTGEGENKILADTLEAIIGAIYLDQGLEETKKFVREKMFWNLLQIFMAEK